MAAPTSPPDGHGRALRHLRRDPRLAALMRRVGPFAPRTHSHPFEALVGAIIHQQVSMAAGRAMYRRVRALCPRGRLSARILAACADEQLRAAGLSRQKAAYVRDVAAHFADRRITPAALRRMPDEEVIATVTQIKGVGRWTAEMLLIFCLQRPDVWPIDDLGLQKAAARLLGMAEPPLRAALEALAEPWRPYRTYATWYLWRSLENPVSPAITH